MKESREYISAFFLLNKFTMGQVPKNIIMAQAGAKLNFNVDGQDIALDNEHVDSLAAELSNEMLRTGELRQEDIPYFMQTYSKWNDQARSGKYHLNTAGPNALVSIKYEGDLNNVQRGLNEKGEPAQRSKFGKFFSHGLKMREEDIMARLNQSLGTKIGGYALSEKERMATEAKTLADKQKALADKTKLETDQKTASEKAIPSDILDYMSKTHFGGSKKWSDTWGTYDKTKKLSLLSGLTKKLVTSELVKPDHSWMSTFKDLNADYDNKDYLKELYSKYYGDYGSELVGSIYGEPTKEDSEKLKETEAQKNTDEATLNDLLSDQRYHAVGNTIITKKPTLEVNGHRLHTVLQKDEKTGKMNEEYIELPPDVDEETADGATILSRGKRYPIVRGVNGERIINMDGKLSNTKNGKIPGPKMKPITSSSVIQTPESGESTPPGTFIPVEPTQQNTSLGKKKGESSKKSMGPVNDFLQTITGFRKEGGILSFQNGGGLDSDLVKRLQDYNSRYDAEEAEKFKKNNVPVEDTSAKTNAPLATGKQQSSTPKQKGAPTIKEMYNAGTSDDIELSEADRLDATALAQDFAGLVIGLTTGSVGGSVASAGLGALSTVNTARADYMRDQEFGLDDWLKTGLSLTADAATLFPYLGEAAQSAKILKNLPKVGRLLQAASLGGLGLGAMSLGDDLITGKKSLTDLNTNDLKMIIGGLRMLSAGTSIRKAVKKQPVEEFEGQIKTPEGKVIPAAIKRIGDEYVIKDEALRASKILNDYPWFGKPKPVGARAEEVVVTPEQHTATSFLGRKAEERENAFRWKAGNQKREDEITELLASKKAERLTEVRNRINKADEGIGNKRTEESDAKKEMAEAIIKDLKNSPLKGPSNNINKKSPESDASKKLITSENKPSIIRSNKKAPPTPTAPAPTREEMLNIASKSKLVSDNNAKEIAKSVVNKVTSGNPKLSKPVVKARIQRLTKSEKAEAIKTQKHSDFEDRTERRDIRKGMVHPKHQDSSLKSINKKYDIGGVLIAQSGNKIWGTKNDYVDNPKTRTPNSPIEDFFNIGLSPQKPSLLKLGETERTDPRSGISGILSKLNFGNNRNLLTEATRVGLLNRAQNNLDTSVSPPLLSPASEINIPVRGDLTLKNSFYNRANTLRNSFTPTSDATRNAVLKAHLEGQASDLERQGDLADNQALQTSQQKSLENTLRNNAMRGEVGSRNTVAMATALQAMKEAKNQKMMTKAMNVDNLLSSQEMRRQTDEDRKRAVSQGLDMEELQNQMEKDNPTLMQEWRTWADSKKPIDPALQIRLQQYQDVFNAKKRAIMMEKEGGSIDKEKRAHEMEIYKQRILEERTNVGISNRWMDKKTARVEKAIDANSKEISSLINKIFRDESKHK
jgi:hypothetical protein